MERGFFAVSKNDNTATQFFGMEKEICAVRCEVIDFSILPIQLDCNRIVFIDK